MKDWTGKLYVLEMEGLERFQDAIGSNNLIGWVEIVRGRRPQRRHLRKLFGTPNPRWPDYFQIAVEVEVERVARTCSGNPLSSSSIDTLLCFLSGFAALPSLRRVELLDVRYGSISSIGFGTKSGRWLSGRKAPAVDFG